MLNSKKPMRQGNVYELLKEKDFHFERGNYSSVTKQLISHPGIVSILERLIIPGINEKFPKETQTALLAYWQRGELPGMAQLEKLKINIDYYKESVNLTWEPYLELASFPDKNNTKVRYVQRWGDFAGVWFEEIDPWLKEQDPSDATRRNQ